MTYATQTFTFDSKAEVLSFSTMLHEWAEKLEDLARVESHQPENTTYDDASILDTIVHTTHADSSSK